MLSRDSLLLGSVKATLLPLPSLAGSPDPVSVAVSPPTIVTAASSSSSRSGFSSSPCLATTATVAAFTISTNSPTAAGTATALSPLLLSSSSLSSSPLFLLPSSHSDQHDCVILSIANGQLMNSAFCDTSETHPASPPHTALVMPPTLPPVCTTSQLMPYKYQVHGHHVILKWTPKTVLKNTNEREELFYETIAQHSTQLRAWMPKYKGHVHIRYVKEGDNILLQLYTDVNQRQETSCKLRIHQGKLEIFQDEQCSASYANVVNGDTPVSEISLSHLNPWSIFTLTRCLPEILQQNPADTPFHRFVVLEDINRKFTCPNILDLKMGTTPLGLGDKSESLRLLKEKKWSATTSNAVGVRVDGMQLFCPDTQSYRCYNKFYGYAMQVADLENVFEEFLQYYNHPMKSRIASNLLHNLQSLHNIVQNLGTYRFFSASIIICTEGRLTRVYQPGLSEIPLTTLGNDNDGDITSLPFTVHNHTSTTTTTTTTSTLLECPTSFSSGLHHQPHLLPFIDVRLVDFEHTTFGGFMNDNETHSGPDEGFLMGLTFLMKALHRFLKLQRISSVSNN